MMSAKTKKHLPMGGCFFLFDEVLVFSYIIIYFSLLILLKRCYSKHKGIAYNNITFVSVNLGIGTGEPYGCITYFYRE